LESQRPAAWLPAFPLPYPESKSTWHAPALPPHLPLPPGELLEVAIAAGPEAQAAAVDLLLGKTRATGTGAPGSPAPQSVAAAAQGEGTVLMALEGAAGVGGAARSPAGGAELADDESIDTRRLVEVAAIDASHDAPGDAADTAASRLRRVVRRRPPLEGPAAGAAVVEAAARGAAPAAAGGAGANGAAAAGVRPLEFIAMLPPELVARLIDYYGDGGPTGRGGKGLLGAGCPRKGEEEDGRTRESAGAGLHRPGHGSYVACAAGGCPPLILC
jgi:hypothetical protein